MTGIHRFNVFKKNVFHTTIIKFVDTHKNHHLLLREKIYILIVLSFNRLCD